MKTPYLSIKQRFLLLVTAALFFGLTTPIHAEGLSGLKDSLNKGKIDSTTIEQTKQQSDISDVPQNSISADKPAAKLQAPVNNVKIKKPERIKEVQAKKSNSILKRIGAPVKTPDRGSYSFSISNFPTIDEKKYNPEALTMLKAMREKATGYANIESDLSDFCAKYPVYTELCNLGRLYLIQQQLKNNKIYDFKTKKYLDELTSEFVYGSNEVTAFIGNEVNLNMVPWLNEFNEKKISQAHTYVLAEIKRLKQEISDITSGIFKPGDLEYLKTEIALKYKRTMEAYYGIALTHLPDRARAKELRDEITNFYNSLSPKIPVSVKMDQNSNPVTIEIDIIKDSRMFILMSSNFVQSDFEHCQFYSTDDKIFNNILSEKSGNQININTFEDLKSRINNPLKGETALEQWEKDNYINHIDKYRKCVSKIKQLYFQKGTSYLGTLSPDYVAKTSECILLKAQVICDDPDPSNFLSRPPIKIEFFSNVSKISSEVTLKKYAITNDYCAVLGNNNANLWPVNDKPDAQKESLACFNGEKINEQLLEFYKTASYFSNDNKRHIFGYSSRKIPSNEDNVIIKNSANFLKSGGCEFVIAETDGKKATVLIENQADWFIVDSHGWILETSGGQGGIIEVDPICRTVFFEFKV